MPKILKEDIMSNDDLITKYSDVAKNNIGKRYILLQYLDYDNLYGGGACNGIDFHPNGVSGCIKLPDDYYAGIRCDHLMYMEGFLKNFPKIGKRMIVFYL